ncbi:MAG: B12-binding domain-containing radical SAM protein [Longimicrobiales bacterium]
MRVTLVQPAQGTRFGFAKVLMVEPLGLECISASLRRHEHDVHLVDLRLDEPRALTAHLQSAEPGAVGITCGFTTDVYSALHTAKLVKDTRPRTFVFVGGHHASLIPGDFLFPGSPVDAVVIAEGEGPALELADTLDRRGEPGAVPGVRTLDNMDNFQLPRRPKSLDELPLPDRLLSKRYRHRYHHAWASPSACVETSRGCPFDCNFCSIWVFYQRRARRRSPERIVEDLIRVRELGEEHVFFTDDIAFLQRDAYEELALEIRATGLKMDFVCETRADLVVKYGDLFKLWKEIGLKTIFLGVEKVDDDGLDSVRKRTKGGADTNLKAIEILRACGITPMTSLITDPAWGEEDFDRLERFVKALDLPNPTFSVLTPLPGTELWETMKSQITTTDYGLFDVMHLVLPAKLGPERFYERFARLYRLADTRAQLMSWKGVAQLAQLVLRGQTWIARRVMSAVRDMRDPVAYQSHPGTTPRPAFVPSNFGESAWVDRSRSALTIQATAGSR